jgi:hypothetical protein
VDKVAANIIAEKGNGYFKRDNWRNAGIFSNERTVTDAKINSVFWNFYNFNKWNKHKGTTTNND